MMKDEKDKAAALKFPAIHARLLDRLADRADALSTASMPSSVGQVAATAQPIVQSRLAS